MCLEIVRVIGQSAATAGSKPRPANTGTARLSWAFLETSSSRSKSSVGRRRSKAKCDGGATIPMPRSAVARVLAGKWKSHLRCASRAAHPIAGFPNRSPWLLPLPCASQSVASLTCNRQTPSGSAAQGDAEAKKKAETLRRVLKLRESSEKPAGEWNTYEIHSRGDTVTVFVNGVEQNRATEVSVQEGHICLQAEGAAVEFRNIKLEPLLR